MSTQATTMLHAIRSCPAVLAFLLIACQSTPPVEVSSSLKVSPELDSLRPADIAVLPIEDRTPQLTATPHLEAMRAAVSQQLVQRFYSPLSNPMVDVRLREASARTSGSPIEPAYLGEMAGAFDEDALLGVQILEWDETSIMKNSRVRFTAQVSLMHSGSRHILWRGSLSGSVKAGGEGPSPQRRPDRAAAAVAVFAEALLQELPRRRVR